jgi:hypothetical protein
MPISAPHEFFELFNFLHDFLMLGGRLLLLQQNYVAVRFVLRGKFAKW